MQSKYSNTAISVLTLTPRRHVIVEELLGMNLDQYIEATTYFVNLILCLWYYYGHLCGLTCLTHCMLTS